MDCTICAPETSRGKGILARRAIPRAPVPPVLEPGPGLCSGALELSDLRVPNHDLEVVLGEALERLGRPLPDPEPARPGAGRECTCEIGDHVHDNAVRMCTLPIPHVIGRLAVAAPPPGRS